MIKFYDFLARVGENRSKAQIEMLKRRYPTMFEVTIDMAAPENPAQSSRITSRVKDLKLQTTHSSR